MKKSWSSIEEDLLKQYKGELDELENSSLSFLKRIGFINEDGITDIGEQYLDSKFIFENGGGVPILRSEVLNLSEVRDLCQSFYGQHTKREKVELFFKSKTEISDSTEVGRILSLLNSLDIISYSKRQATVQFHETEEVEQEEQSSFRITHRTPYSNLKRLRTALRACEGEIMWVAKHFPRKGLEPLSEEVTGDQFDSVQILCGPANVDLKLRDDFKRFQKEMDNRGISAELRVITDKNHLYNLHDRWLLSDGASWNIPPVNSLYQNQEAEIHEASEEVSFNDWWNNAKDIISDWNGIQGHI